MPAQRQREGSDSAKGRSVVVFLTPKHLQASALTQPRGSRKERQEDEEEEGSIDWLNARVRYRRVLLDEQEPKAKVSDLETGISFHEQGEKGTQATHEDAGSQAQASLSLEQQAGEGTTQSDEAETGEEGEEEEGISIAPPPSFHFALNRVTPIADILAHPERFGDGEEGAPRVRLNLIVLVREVGPLETYEPKCNRGPGSLGGGVGASSRWRPPAMGYRSHLVVCDRDGSLLKLMLWDRCARIWAQDEDEEGQEEADDAQSRADISRRGGSSRMPVDETTVDDATTAKSKGRKRARRSPSAEDSLSQDVSALYELPPRALRPGDVVYLTKLILHRNHSSHGKGKGKAPAAGAGPTSAAAAAALRRFQSSSSIALSTTSESDVQLCFRADVRARRDEAYAYLGPERVVGSELAYLAEFDAHCRAVWQLVRRWL